MLMNPDSVRHLTVEEKRDHLGKYFTKKKQLNEAFTEKRCAKLRCKQAEHNKEIRREQMTLYAEHDNPEFYSAACDHADATEILNSEQEKYTSCCEKCNVIWDELKGLRDEITKTNVVLGLL